MYQTRAKRFNYVSPIGLVSPEILYIAMAEFHCTSLKMACLAAKLTVPVVR